MARLARITLVLLGLAIFILGCSALIYTNWPVEYQMEQARPAPTLFAPP